MNSMFPYSRSFRGVIGPNQAPESDKMVKRRLIGFGARLATRGVYTLVVSGGLSVGIGATVCAQPSEPRIENELGQIELDRKNEIHSVEPGDTLWDICGKYLSSAWYWPKVWSYNPQLTNPHWIYPGNEIRLSPGENLPAPVKIARTINGENEDLTIPGRLTDEDLVQTVGAISVGKISNNSVWMAQAGFVTKSTLEKAGRIDSSLEESILLSDYDTIYVKAKAPLEVGAQHAVYRVGRSIQHPITGVDFGYAVHLVGIASVLKDEGKLYTAQLTRSIRPVMRGDILASLPEGFGQRVDPIPNEVNLDGYVLDTSGDVLGPLGEHHIVFVDRGQDDGVRVGNTFNVFQRGDRYTDEKVGLPDEEVGMLMVMSVQKEASTAIMLLSTKEIAVGDRIRMRASRQTAAIPQKAVDEHAHALN